MKTSKIAHYRPREYTLLTSSAPAKGQYGSYGHCAIVEHDPGYKPTQISCHPKAVHGIIGESGRLYWGGERSALVSYRANHLYPKLVKLQQTNLAEYLAAKAGYQPENDALLPSDMVAIRKPTSNIIIRYDQNWKKTGVAIRMPKDLVKRFGKFEHGANVAQCKAEIAHKRQIVAYEIKQRHTAAKMARRLHLVTVLCNNLTVKYEHARKAGMCDAGIRGFCNAHNFDVNIGATIAQIRATRDWRAKKAIEVAAQELINVKQIAA